MIITSSSSSSSKSARLRSDVGVCARHIIHTYVECNVELGSGMRHRLDNRAGQDGEDEHTHTQKCTNRQTNKPKKLEDSLVLLVLVVPMEFFFGGERVDPPESSSSSSPS